MNENWDLTQGISEIQLLKEKVEALTEIVHNPNFVLIVRCKDCLEAKEIRPGRYSCFLFAGTNDGNWYCADGKRRKDND